MERLCEWCSETFSTSQKTARFCKRDHFTNCKYCSKEFLIKNIKTVPIYCSQSCGSKDREYSLICEFCHKEFVSKKAGTKWCKGPHFKNCVSCGKEFSFNVYSKNDTKTCSKKCAASLINFSDRNKKSAETLTEKYGVEITNASQLDEVKKKKVESFRAKHGVDNPSQLDSVKEKRKQTNLERYGVENGGGASEVQAKIKQTNLDKYGVENVFQVEEFKNKGRETFQKKYGRKYTNPSQVPELRQKSIETMLNRYGVESMLSLPEIQQMSSAVPKRRVSKENLKWKETLEKELKVVFETEGLAASSVYSDLRHKNVFIDINPTVTHSATSSFVHLINICKEIDCDKQNHKPISKNNHQERFLKAEESGNTFLQFFDWCDPKIFVSVVRSKLHLDENRVYARNCEMKEIAQKEANQFFNENHLLGSAKGQSFCVGLFYDNELVHAQTYGPARLNKNYEWEAIRSCSKMNWQIIGGFSKCDAFFFRKKNPNSVISYVDLAISTGETEKSNPGWKLISTNPPTSTWVDLLGYDKETVSKTAGKQRPKFIRDLTARRISADRLLGYEMGEKYPTHNPDGSAFTNDQVLISEGYVQVFDTGTRTFGWRK